MYCVFWEGATRPSFKFKKQKDAEKMVHRMRGQKKGFIEHHYIKNNKNVIIRLNDKR